VKFNNDWAKPAHHRFADDTGKAPLGSHELEAKTAAACLIDKWSDTSGDHDGLALRIQDRAEKVFGLTETWKDKRGSAGAYIVEQHENRVIDSFLKATYQHTQDTLKKADVEELQLHRGYVYDDKPRSGSIEASLQSLSSFSRDRNVAVSFTDSNVGEHGAVISARVPRERIFSTALTGPGCLNEDEVIVLGGKLKCREELLF
jgi:hypothetical protein